MGKPNTYRTGRNVQFNSKVTAERSPRVYKAADKRAVVIDEVLCLAMDALEREGPKIEAPQVGSRECIKGIFIFAVYSL